jgi:AhpC/TSA antioxidant enzyme
MTQRGGTFLFDAQNKLAYEHRDHGILGFSANPSYPLSFIFADRFADQFTDQSFTQKVTNP